MKTKDRLGKQEAKAGMSMKKKELSVESGNVIENTWTYLSDGRPLPSARAVLLNWVWNGGSVTMLTVAVFTKTLHRLGSRGG
jgi:hypothetical protein